MKSINKKHVIIAFLAVIVLFLSIGCEKTDKEKTVSGTVTANTEGVIIFMYSPTQKENPDFCTFTTDLPSPDDQFIVTVATGETSGKKEIEGLSDGQKVTWTAKVAGKPLDHGSGNFVHIVND